MGATTIGPEEETSVQLDFMMHEGMEGSHLFAIEVPLEMGSVTLEPIHLAVRGDFR